MWAPHPAALLSLGRWLPHARTPTARTHTNRTHARKHAGPAAHARRQPGLGRPAAHGAHAQRHPPVGRPAGARVGGCEPSRHLRRFVSVCVSAASVSAFQYSMFQYPVLVCPGATHVRGFSVGPTRCKHCSRRACASMDKSRAGLSACVCVVCTFLQFCKSMERGRGGGVFQSGILHQMHRLEAYYY